MEIFYLGAPEVAWLERARVPLFVSHRRLVDRVKLPKAAARWALDSGGYSEVQLHGTWVTSAEAYVDAVRRYKADIGMMDWAAPQDWMCDPTTLQVTGLTVAEHQRRTVANFLKLKKLAPECPFMPVLQGWTEEDYLNCVAMYYAAGIALHEYDLVGVGSIARRQDSPEVESLLTRLADGPTWGSERRKPRLFADQGLKLHGFGVKRGGLLRYAHALRSADSMAWSFEARHAPPIQGHPHQHCANCLVYALRWRALLLKAVEGQAWGDPRHETFRSKP